MLTQKQLGKKIKSLREEKEVSQDELAKKIGLSRPAVSALERGGRGIDTLELAKIAKFFNLTMDELVSPWIEAKGSKSKEVDINKNLKFNPEKLRQLLLYILERCGGKPNFGETVLYKLLYFIDFDSFENLGKPIAGMNYVKLQYGPVPQAKQFQAVVEKMKEKKEIKSFVQVYHGMKQKRYLALVDSNLDSFSIQEKNIIDEVIDHLSHLSATQIEAYSHGDVPWQATASRDVIPYDLVVDREPPYTKKDYWQMWQDAAGEDTLKHLGPISKDEADYYANL